MAESCSCGLPPKSDAYKTVSPKEFSIEIKSPEIFLIDVRKPEEYGEGHIAGAHNIDVTSEDFLEKAKSILPKDRTIAVYCGSGKRSAIASGKLTGAGYTILNLDGGLSAWIASGLPVTKD